MKNPNLFAEKLVKKRISAFSGWRGSSLYIAPQFIEGLLLSLFIRVFQSRDRQGGVVELLYIAPLFIRGLPLHLSAPAGI